ncbi:hypothetical protein [Vibrio sinaloensis]|uniref:hypothetical protein n=1 Tax=Photobacterium sp. (strain ATCC 43367) TaxID=379097 RepID=UPI0035F0CD2E
MDKKILLGLALFGFLIGALIYPNSSSSPHGKYISNAISLVKTPNRSNPIYISFHFELELFNSDRYELMALTPNQSGTFTSGSYVYNENEISFIEANHDAFYDTRIDIPFWEKVLISPNTLGGEENLIFPMNDVEKSFILFNTRSAYLMTRT